MLDKARAQISFDCEDGFWLYRKDLRECMLEEGMEITPFLYERIREEKVLLYAKKKTLEMLERMDRTEAELRKKLKDKEFAQDIIDQAISYAKKFHYVDDLRFASNFIHTRCRTKSRKQIAYALYQKGVAKELVDQAFNDYQAAQEELQEDVKNPEVIAIEKIVRRKGKPVSEFSKEELMKLTASLYRKGFHRDNIKRVLEYDGEWE